MRNVGNHPSKKFDTNGMFNCWSYVATEARDKHDGLGDDKDGGPRTKIIGVEVFSDSIDAISDLEGAKVESDLYLRCYHQLIQLWRIKTGKV
jgi:hypothetical protein